MSAYTYERTLMMEQRSQMLRQMRLSVRDVIAVTSSGGEWEGGMGGASRLTDVIAGEARKLRPFAEPKRRGGGGGGGERSQRTGTVSVSGAHCHGYWEALGKSWR